MSCQINACNNLVYITESKLQNISYSLARKYGTRNMKFHDIELERRLTKVLSRGEMNLLASFQLLCDDSNDALVQYVRVGHLYTNDNLLFSSASSHRYHSSPACKNMRTEFKNYLIPAEITTQRDPALINEFRRFAEEHWDLYLNGDNQFYLKMKMRFRLSSEIKPVNLGNSGAATVENMKLEEIKEKVLMILDEAERFRNRDRDTYDIISRLGYATHKRTEAKKPGHPLYIWDKKYKAEIKSLLKTYFRIKLNPELAFDGRLLEQLGFERCKSCF